MSTQWQPNSILHAEEPPSSVDLTLFQLGQDLVAPGPVQRIGTTDPQTYCSNCWARMPEDATECADCGQSLATMQAEEQARVARDRAWVPPGRAGIPLESVETYGGVYDEELPADLEPVEVEAPARKGRRQKAGRVRAPKLKEPRQPRVRSASNVNPDQLAPFAIALLIGSALGVLGGSSVWLMLTVLRSH